MTKTTRHDWPEIMTVADLSEYLHLSKNTIRQMLRDDKIPGAVKTGRDWRIKKQDVDDWFSSGGRKQ